MEQTFLAETQTHYTKGFVRCGESFGSREWKFFFFFFCLEFAWQSNPSSHLTSVGIILSFYKLTRWKRHHISRCSYGSKDCGNTVMTSARNTSESKMAEWLWLYICLTLCFCLLNCAFIHYLLFQSFLILLWLSHGFCLFLSISNTLQFCIKMF